MKIIVIIIIIHFAVIVIASPVRDKNRSGVSSYCFCLKINIIRVEGRVHPFTAPLLAGRPQTKSFLNVLLILMSDKNETVIWALFMFTETLDRLMWLCGCVACVHVFPVHHCAVCLS